MAVHLTRIYTRTGDDGTTGLSDFSRVSKNDPRLVAYADCDEANDRSRRIPERLGFGLDRTEDVVIEAPAETGRRLIWVIEDRAQLAQLS